MFSFPRKAAVALTAVAGVVMAFPAPVHAIPPPDNISEVLTGVGSDTTADVMKALVQNFNPSGFNADHDRVRSVPPVLPPGGSFTVPADSNCGSFTYSNPGNLPPAGSSAGISALVADTQGCLDWARSSRGRTPSDPTSLKFYAYAKDALSFAFFRDTACPGTDTGAKGCAKANLTLQQIRDIYLCTEPAGPKNVPKVTDWSQVGGDPGAIKRFIPQSGSGTLSFFETKILGLTSSQQGVLDDTDCQVPPTRTEEHDARTISAGDKPVAITPFSFAKWTSMANGVIPDFRNGDLRLGQINGVAPSLATIGNNSFFGVRYVYNVAKTTGPTFGPVRRFLGLDGGGNGWLCDPNQSAPAYIIQAYGFVPLDVAPAGPGLPNSRCRRDPTPI